MGEPEKTREELNAVSGEIVDAAINVHSALGPGLLESAYEACLNYELEKRGLAVESQVALPIIYEEVKLEAGYRLDLLVERSVIVELKTVDELSDLHKAQLLSYLKMSGCKIGLLLNFKVPKLKLGIKRLVNGLG